MNRSEQLKKHDVFLLLLGIIALLMSNLCVAQNSNETWEKRWTEEQANEWYSHQPWMAGCNYIPASAINQIEMWQASTFDAKQIDKELNWAEGLGFNTMRVFLSSVVWNHDAKGFKKRIDKFLTISSRHHIRPLFVFFDDCWNAESAYGKQPDPKIGVHNSGWLQDPSCSLRSDTVTLYRNLESYVKDILTTFKNDRRILMWDLYNEPGNTNHGDNSLPLLRKVFEWAFQVRPSQPITSGAWNGDNNISRFQLSHSDIISYHNYSDEKGHAADIAKFERYHRPLVCTEYMARTNGSRFSNIMPLLKEHRIVAINWGFVKGKTNTIYAWGTPIPSGEEPKIWFHDIYRQDGTPFSEDEITFIRSMMKDNQ